MTKFLCRHSHETYERLWNLLVRKLEEACRQESGRAIARKIDVAPATVSRWISGTRGKDVSMKDALNIIHKLGVNMGEVVAELMPDDAEVIMAAWNANPDMLEMFAKIITAGGPEVEKLNAELKYLSEKVENKSD